MKKQKTFKFETKVDNFELMSSDYVKATINVCHKGKNRNKTDFTDGGMKSIEDSILCKPIVCEYIEDKGRVGGHGGKIEVSDEGTKFIDTTFEVGFVDPRTKPYYKTFTEKDGVTQNNYLCVDVILWTSRHDFLREELEKGLGQSFEIEVNSFDYREDDDYLVVKDANVHCLCLLGNVEPCFSASKVQLNYSIDERKSVYEEMLNKFMKQFSLEGGDELMDETVVETVVETEKQQTEDVKTTEVESKTDDETVVEEQEVETEQAEVVDYEAKFNELQVEHGKTIAKLDDMTQEFERLQKFEQDILTEKRIVSENELFEKFSALENEEDFINLKENVNKYSLEEIENMCYAILGRKSFSLNKKSNTQTTQKLKVDTYNKKVDADPYGGLLK